MLTKNKLIQIIFIITISFYNISKLNAQSLAPQVIASAGGYQNNSIGSLSFTIGETNTQTLNSSNNILTQGFQQPIKLSLQVKAFLQGYYEGLGLMKNVLYNQGINALPSNLCDTITIQLRQASSPNNVVFETKEIIQTNGMVTCNPNIPIGQSYYIVLKHRNTIESWSANPIFINENTYYDFSSSANQSYGANQVEVEPNIFAFYSGDINQDENIDLLDVSFLEVDINNFEFGYFPTDINGDGNVDLLDAPIVENNINGFIYSIHP